MKTTSNNWNIFWFNQKEKSQQVSYSKKRIINILNNYIKTNCSVADAGCGSGFFSKYFLTLTNKVFSIDYSESALKLCKKNCENKTKLLKTDLLQHKLHQKCGNKLDVIFTDGLLEHFELPEQLRILQNFKNSLTSNGRIITFVPNRFSPWQIIRPLFMPNIEEKPFILKDLIKLHKAVGLSIIDSGGINVLPLKYSPEESLGKYFGMLLYVVCEQPKNE